MRVLAFLLLWLTAAPALAHAVLLDSVPADGARVETPPAAIVLRFNEGVAPIAIRVIDVAGNTVAGPDGAEVTDGAVRLPVSAMLPAGLYTVSYRVTSSDSHPVAGALMFGLRQTPEGVVTSPAEPAGEPALWPLLRAFNRAIGDAAVLVAAGGALFLVLVGAAAVQPVLFAGIGLASLSALLGLGLQGVALGGLAGGDLYGGVAWRLGAASTLGMAALLVLAGSAVLAAGLLTRRRLILVVGAGLLLSSFVISGHAATAAPRWLTGPVMYLHVGGLAFWMGSLWPLHVLVSANGSAAAPLVRRFSRLALGLVAMLLLAGLMLLAVQVPTLAGLTGTHYGRILLFKLAFVVTLLLLALHNRQRLTPALATGDTLAASRLIRAIRIEIAIIAAVLFLTAMLGTTPPPRALALDPGTTVAAPGRAVVTFAPDHALLLELDPARAGRNTLTLTLTTEAGTPLAAKEVNVALAHPAAGIEELVRPAAAAGEGRWRLAGPEFSVAGRWRVRVMALVTDFKMLSFETDFDVD